MDEEHIPMATHLSRNDELDIEEKVPDLNTLIICHQAAAADLPAADSLQKMGYKNVRSMAGGFKA
jgi:rhodanese-related sulfurtransferase